MASLIGIQYVLRNRTQDSLLSACSLSKLVYIITVARMYYRTMTVWEQGFAKGQFFSFPVLVRATAVKNRLS